MSLNLTPFLVTGRVLDFNQDADPVAVACSVRKTNSNYSGPCCRVRRQDGQEKDIYFVQTDIDIESLRSFVGKGDAWVTIWYDQSGNGFHARQPVWDLQPMIAMGGSLVTDPDNHQISLRFDGKQFLDTAYTPSESDVNGSGIQLAGSAGLGSSSTRQGGAVYEYGRWTLDRDVITRYPEASLPLGYDLTFLESQPIESTSLLYNAYNPSTGETTYGLLGANVDLDEDRAPVNANVSVTNTVTAVDVVSGPGELSVRDIPFTSSAGSQKFCKIVDLQNNFTLAVPHHDNRLVKIDGRDGVATVVYTFSSIDPENSPGMFSTALLVGNYVYCIPYNYPLVVRIHKDLDQSPQEINANSLSGAFLDAVSLGQYIYCIPYNNPYVFRVDTNNFSNSINIGLELETSKALYATGAAVGNIIICPPYNAATVLRIDPSITNDDDKVQLVGSTGVNLQLHNVRTNQRESRLQGGGRGYIQPEVGESPISGQVGNPHIGSDSATFTANVQLTKIMTKIEVTNGGSGYSGTSPPSVSFDSNDVYWNIYPLAEVNPTDIVGGEITKVTLMHGGDGYMLEETDDVIVYFNGGRGKDAQAYVPSLNGDKVSQVLIVPGEQGSGYISRPTVEIIGGNPDRQATATAIVDFSTGQLTDISVNDEGLGYRSVPTEVRISGGRGSSATAKASIKTDGKVVGINLIDGGSGYANAETFTYTEWVNNGKIREESAIKIDLPSDTSIPDGTPPSKGNVSGLGYPPQAVARIDKVDSGVITEIKLLWCGNGYLSAPGVSIGDRTKGYPGPGTGGSATASFKQDGRLDDVTLTHEGSKYLLSPTITVENRKPDEASNYSVFGNSIKGTARVFMYLDTATKSDGAGGDYRYRRDTPSGEGKFVSCQTYNGSVYAFPYNTHRCIKIEADGTWTYLRVDFGLEMEKYAASVLTPTSLYAIPYKHRRILKVDSTGITYVADLTGETLFQGEWRSAAFDSNTGVIYAAPSNSDYLLAIDTKEDRMTRLLTIPAVSATRGDNKFSSVAASSLGGLLYACPDDGDKFIEISLSRVTLPAPGVLLEDGRTVAYPPRGTQIVTLTIDPSSDPVTVTKQTYSIADLNQTFGDGCLLPGGSKVAWIPYYSITSTTFEDPKIVVIDYSRTPPVISHVQSSFSFDLEYLVPYPSRSAVALDENTVAWVPQKSTVPIVLYDIQDGSLNDGLGPARVSPSVSYATATLVDGDTVVGTAPDDVVFDNDDDVSGFTTRINNTSYIRYEDSCLTPDGKVVLVPCLEGAFKVWQDGNWVDSPPISFPQVNSIRMGGGASSSLDNKVYAVPFNHDRVLVLNTTDNLVEEYRLPGGLGRNQELWKGAVEAGSFIFGVPYRSQHILVIDPLNTNPIQKLTLKDTGMTTGGKWWGGVLSPVTNRIYCAPHNASSVLVITPGEFPEDTIFTTIAVPPEFLSGVAQRWATPCTGPDGKIYFPPWNENGVLVMDPSDNSFDKINVYSLVTEKYSTMLLLPSNNLIMVPYRERSFVELDVSTGKFELFNDYGTSDLKFRTAVYVPQLQQVLAFPNYLKGIESLTPRRQHLFFYKGGQFTKGAEVPRFRMTPKPKDGLVLLHDESTIGMLRDPSGIVNLETEGVVFTSPVVPGVLGWHNGGEWTITSSFRDTFSLIIPGQGGFCGAKSFSGTSDLLTGIKNNGTFTCRTGDNTSEIQGLFSSLFRDGVMGVFSMYSDANRMYTFFRDVEVNRETFLVQGDVGSTLSIGRIYGRQYKEVTVPEISTTLSGLLSEVLVFRVDVKDLATRIGENQNYYFRELKNLKLK